MKIAVVAPSCTSSATPPTAVEAIVAARGDCELVVHPQCFLSEGHFAGPDEARLAALREVMADSSIDAVWFARGGYGSNRIAEPRSADLPDAARGKTYMGYSDAGFLLAGLHKAGVEVAWGPMPQDVLREGGDAAIHRALDWLVRRDPAALEPQLERAGDGLQPDGAFEPARDAARARLHRRRSADRGGRRAALSDRPHHVPCHGSANVRGCARLRLGRVADILANDPRIRVRRGGDCRGLVRAVRASHSAAARTSATMLGTGWFRSPLRKS